jgi:16S rRNA (uracil1498-N3)-methyltransferase
MEVRMADRFFHPDPLVLGPVTLTGQEAHHLAHVLRVRPGALLRLFNGDGAEYPAHVVSVGKSRVEVHVESRLEVSREASRSVTVACPLPKGDRGLFLMEKLTELGVTCYIPLRTERSVVHPGEGKTDKLNRQVVEASKQCGRNVLMRIEAISSWSDLVHRHELPTSRWLADPSGEAPGTNLPADHVIALGPEGGWTEHEVQLGTEQGWQVVSLGKSVLRIETAALAATSLSLLGR